MSAASTLCLKCKTWVDGDIDDHACGRASAPEPDDAVASSPQPKADSSRRQNPTSTGHATPRGAPVEVGGCTYRPARLEPTYETPPTIGIVQPSADALAVLESDEATDLAVRRICDAIATCMDFESVRNIADRAIAIRAYHRQRGAQLRIQNQVARVRFEAERRLGILLRDEVKVARGRKGSAAGPLLADLKITKKQSSIWQQIADVSDEDFEQRCRDAFENNLELTTRRVLALPVPERKPKTSVVEPEGTAKVSPLVTTSAIEKENLQVVMRGVRSLVCRWRNRAAMAAALRELAAEIESVEDAE